jgi:flagellin-like protein
MGPSWNKGAVALFFGTYSTLLCGEIKYGGCCREVIPYLGEEDKKMNNENRNEEAVSPVIATILMVAITVVLAGVLYVWASSLAGDSTGGGLDTYTFSDRDASGDMGETMDDALVHVQMTQGDGLSWAVLKVSIVVDGGASYTCSTDATNECTIGEPAEGDKSWDTSEEITISESGTDLCDGANGGCEVVVTLTKIGVGEEDDKVIATVTAYADGN